MCIRDRLSSQDLEKFTHTAKPATCGLCTNHCSLTVNTLSLIHI